MYNDDELTKSGRQRSKPRQVVFLVVWIIVFAILFFEVIKLAGYTIGKVDKSKMYTYNFVNNVVNNIIKDKETTITKTESVKLATAGNIYATSNIITGAKKGNKYDFSSGFESIITKMKEYDVVLASLSTPVANDLGLSNNKVYTAPESILSTLNSLNVTAVATATYRAMDKNIEGLKATIGNLSKYNISQTGISDEKNVTPIVITKNDIRIGFISYATKSNIGISKSNTGYVRMISEENVQSDVKYLKEQNVDIIVTYLDVPNGDATVSTSSQKTNTELLFKNGVNIVVTSGGSVVLDSVSDNIELSDNTKISVYSFYSVGDLMGGYNSSIESACIVPTFEITKTITKNIEDGEILDSKVKLTVNKPIKIWTEISSSYVKKVYIMDDEIQNFNLGKSSLSSKQYSKMKEQYDRILEMYN